MIKNYVFTDRETGEDFIVEATHMNEAMTIARGLFESPQFVFLANDFEAEMLGYDTY